MYIQFGACMTDKNIARVKWLLKIHLGSIMTIVQIKEEILWQCKSLKKQQLEC